MSEKEVAVAPGLL